MITARVHRRDSHAPLIGRGGGIVGRVPRWADTEESLASDAIGASRTFAFGPFKLIPARQLLLRDDKPVRIGGRALDLLIALVERPGELVTKSELLALVWPDTNVDEANLKVNMATLRRVLEDGPATPYIATVVGRGYRFVAQVHLSGAVELPPEASTPPTPTNNLPASTTRIFGREEPIASLRRDLDQSRLVSIVGSGGIGKTTVAIAVAERAGDAFADGVWFVDLAPLTDADRIANAIAAALGVRSHSTDVISVVCEFLRDRQALLVLDNCEHVIDGVASCTNRILSSAAGVRILATSREPLRMAKERVRRLAGLATPRESVSLDARSALDFSAVQLFVERATEGHSAFQLRDADAPIVAQICRNLDGLALAIELAASRVGAFGVAGILRQLDDRFRLLAGWRTGPERQRTLAATLDWSYALLDAHEAKLLRAVSVFAASFDLDGACAVSAGTSIEVLDVLANLAAKSLLVVEPVGDGIACRLLETTRAYSIGRLRTSNDEHDVRVRHAEHVCAVLDRANAEWPRCPIREWDVKYRPVIDDLRSAIAWAGSNAANRTLFIRLVVAGLRLWNHLSLTDECRTIVSRALGELASAGLSGTAIEMQLQMSFADTNMFTRGPSTEVQTALLRTLEIAERIGDVDYRLRGLRTLGSYQSFSGNSKASLSTLETFVVVATEHDPSALPDGETHLGISELFVGRLAHARRRLERLHQRSAVSSDDARLARFLYDRKVDIGNVLSYAQWLTGSPDTAMQTAVSTVEQALEVKHGLSLINALAVAACPTFYLSGRYDECEQYVSMLENEVRKQGVVIWSSMARFFRGALSCARLDSPERGLVDLERAIAEFRVNKIGTRRSWILAVHADALAQSGRLEDAELTIREALEWGRTYSQGWCASEVLRIQASILGAQGHVEQAEKVLGEAIELARENGGLSWRLRAGVDLARLWCARSRTDEARTMLLAIYAEFTEGFATRDLRSAAELIAACDG
ncbi:Signal transduction response regulator [Minicystis rosea]|nr:Signal transduction response regulator [Minicystis rosea]